MSEECKNTAVPEACLDSVQLETPDILVPSYLSVKSDQSAEYIINFNEGTSNQSLPDTNELKEELLDFTLTAKSLKSTLKNLMEEELKQFRRMLTQECPECFKDQLGDGTILDVKEIMECFGNHRAVKVTLHMLGNMKRTDLADLLVLENEKNQYINEGQQKLKVRLKLRFDHIFEGLAKQGNSVLLSNIYTELYITEGESEGINNEHEVREAETLFRKPSTEETKIKCSDIFKPLPGQNKYIRTVLSKGIAGIGKTVSVQKFILDWAEGKENMDVTLIFPLQFRDLNLERNKKYSLMQLIYLYFPEVKEIKHEEFSELNVVLIFDGLDECRFQLDFKNNKTVSDVTEATSIDVLLTNLIKGSLLPSALIWLTSRPAATCQIPPEYVDRVTEIQGFNDPEKEKYFKKRFSDLDLANRIVSHIKTSRSLYIMCHIPVFCWISAIVLEQMLSDENKGEIPSTLTQMYTHFLIIQISRMNLKYLRKKETEQEKQLQSDREIILKLSELAFQQLEQGNIIFYEEDLKECGIDVCDASVYSGVCTEIFREEYVTSQRKVYSFVHLSVQEFLAAVHVFESYRRGNTNLLDKTKAVTSEAKLFDLHKSAVDKALQSKNGHLDLFLRFLLGVSLDSNHSLLQTLLTKTEISTQSFDETIRYIRKIIREDIPTERSINLFHCLNEMNDNSLVQEIQKYLNSGNLSRKKLSPTQWSALVFVLLTSQDLHNVFDLKKYIRSESALQKMLPVAKLCQTMLLDNCNLTEDCSKELASVLSTNPHLRELDLSDNDLGDSGVRHLCVGLKNPVCKLKMLRLNNCKLTERCCEALASSFSSGSSQLRELHLSDNKINDSGVELLSDGLRSPHCKLITLRLRHCKLTEKCCEVLASILRSNSSHLRELDLNDNDVRDSGVNLLFAGLKNHLPCNLVTLRLHQCKLTDKCCDALASAIISNSSYLKDLDLSNNDLQDSGVKQLSVGLGNPHCKLETLRLSGCQVTEEGCSSLASALRSNPSHLRELDLSYNHPGDSGVKLLSAVLENPSCKLEKLNVDCGGECRIRPGLLKYACQLSLDPNTVHRNLPLSESNRKVMWGRKKQPYPDHPERFDYRKQVLCRESLSGRCYWEAERTGKGCRIGITSAGICRKGRGDDCMLGYYDKSWLLECSGKTVIARHQKKDTMIPAPSSSIVGVYLDSEAGTLSFYSVSSGERTLLYRFTSTFSEPQYAGFLIGPDSSVCICQL